MDACWDSAVNAFNYPDKLGCQDKYKSFTLRNGMKGRAGLPTL